MRPRHQKRKFTFLKLELSTISKAVWLRAFDKVDFRHLHPQSISSATQIAPPTSQRLTVLHYLLTVLSPTIMNNTGHSIPEPLLPEHQLLAEAAPKIELSANFRSHVLAECAASHALAQKLFAAKVVVGIVIAIFAASMVYVWWNSEPLANPKMERPAAMSQPNPSMNPISSGNISTSEHLMTNDAVVPAPDLREGTAEGVRKTQIPTPK